jgi:hypothetical protein
MDKSEIKRIVNEIQTQKDVLKPEVRVEYCSSRFHRLSCTRSLFLFHFVLCL